MCAMLPPKFSNYIYHESYRLRQREPTSLNINVLGWQQNILMMATHDIFEKQKLKVLLSHIASSSTKSTQLQ